MLAHIVSDFSNDTESFSKFCVYIELENILI